jgi:hypothetical protein
MKLDLFNLTHSWLIINTVGKNRHTENKRTQSTHEYNVETPKPEKKSQALSKPTTIK